MSLFIAASSHGNLSEESDDERDTESYIEIDSDQEDYSSPAPVHRSPSPATSVCTSSPDDDDTDGDKDDDACETVVSSLGSDGEARDGGSMLSLDFFEGNGDDDLFGSAFPADAACLLDDLDVSDDGLKGFLIEARAVREEAAEVLACAESMCQEGEARVAAAYKREQAGISVGPYTSIAATVSLVEYRAWQKRVAESSELLFRGSEALGVLIKNAAGKRLRDDETENAMRVSRLRLDQDREEVVQARNQEQDARINRARSLLQQVETGEDGGRLDLDLVEARAKRVEADLRRQEKVALVRAARARVDDAAAHGTVQQTLLDALQDAECMREATESIYREQFRFADHAVGLAAEGFYPRCSIRVKGGGLLRPAPTPKGVLQRCKGKSSSGKRCGMRQASEYCRHHEL